MLLSRIWLSEFSYVWDFLAKIHGNRWTHLILQELHLVIAFTVFWRVLSKNISAFIRVRSMRTNNFVVSYYDNCGLCLVVYLMLRSAATKFYRWKHCIYWWSSMLDVEFYRLYTCLWACDLMLCLCRVFLRFLQKLAVFFTILP